MKYLKSSDLEGTEMLITGQICRSAKLIFLLDYFHNFVYQQTAEVKKKKNTSIFESAVLRVSKIQTICLHNVPICYPFS